MLTENLMRQYDACWGGQDYAKVIARHGTGALTPRQVAADEEISLSHRIWALATALVHRRPRDARMLTGQPQPSVFTVWYKLTGDLLDSAESLAGLLGLLGPDADGWTEVAP